MIFFTTVVFPEPVPPAIPIINIRLNVFLKQNKYFCIRFKDCTFVSKYSINH